MKKANRIKPLALLIRTIKICFPFGVFEVFLTFRFWVPRISQFFTLEFQFSANFPTLLINVLLSVGAAAALSAGFETLTNELRANQKLYIFGADRIDTHIINCAYCAFSSILA